MKIIELWGPMAPLFYNQVAHFFIVNSGGPN